MAQAMKQVCFTVIFIVIVSGCAKQYHIEQRPIQFDSTRTALSLEYLDTHYGIEQNSPSIDPKMIVIHWTAIPSFQKTFDVFDPPTLRNTRPDIEGAGALNVSAHYLIDRDGYIAQLLPDTVMARHVIGLNHTAIGIENVGSDSLRLTDAQLHANTWLIRQLVEKHDIRYLIGHSEYKKFENHALWKELDEGYRTDKTDPGAEFMIHLRKRLDDLNLEGGPD